MRVNRTQVKSLEDFRSASSQMSRVSPFVLRVKKLLRDGTRIGTTVVVKPVE